jgi:multiple sugar transport system ATP-binding protein
MRREIKMLQKKLNITTIYVTHDQVEAMSLSDRIVIMNEGKIMQTGTQDEIYNYPSNKWVGGFIGSPAMNFLDCNLEEKEGTSSLVGAGFAIRIDEQITGAIKEKTTSSELILGIRPEHVSITKDATPQSIEGILELLEPLGESVIADISVGENIFKAKVECDFEMELGTKVFIIPNMDHLHLFDKKTEEALHVKLYSCD